MTDDSKLHQLFQSGRAAERTETPPFGRVMARRVPPRHWTLPSLVVAGATAVLAAAVVLFQGGDDPTRELEMARQVMAWRSSTDFLLPVSVPGLVSLPRIGAAPAGSPLQALDPGNVLGPPALPRSPRS